LLKPTGTSTQHSQPSPARDLIRHTLIALSLANLCFVSAWKRRLSAASLFLPLWSWQDLAALVLNVTVLGLVFFLLLWLASRKKPFSRLLYAIVFSLPLIAVSNLIRVLFFESALSKHSSLVVVAISAVPILFAAALFRWKKELIPIVEFVTLGLAVLIPINVIQAAIDIHSHGPLPQLAARLPGTPRSRVVWLIFDEMDYTLTFPRRPPGINVPELDRLRSQSLFATSARQPGRDTADAIPGLLTGRRVTRVRPQGTHALLVQFSGDPEFVDFTQLPNAFSDARSAQINVGVVGWYFPYCRMFPSDVTDCEWASMYSGVGDIPNVWASFRSQFFSLTPLESRMRQIRRAPILLAKAQEIASDPSLGLVMVHFPLPHGPEIFDRNTGRVTPFALHKDWYFDNLILSDRMLGELRDAMERAGMWDSSAVIFSSDHSLREEMMPHPNPTPLVPFMVKCPGQHVGSTYEVPMNTITTRDLIRALEVGEVSAETLPTWLRTHSR
jgi:hypothetical protein